MIDYRIALAGLLRHAEPPVPPGLADYVTAVGAQEAWATLIGRDAPEGAQQSVAARFGSMDRGALIDQARADLRAAAAVGAEILGPEDDEWPGGGFEPLAWTRPFEQCPTAAVPLALYRRGPRWPRTARGAVAIVGSRAATPYGVRVTADIAADAAAAGFTVVSGAAYGVDAAAHRGALHGAGGTAGDTAPTVAVLACGVDRAYPTAHRALIDGIAVEGAVISEYAPGTPPGRHRFLVRNRLIAALAEATVVVEAGRRSGSLNTASTAAGLGRQVLAVPGPVTSAMSIGCHDLIRGARATLAASWDDIEDQLGPVRPEVSSHRAGDRPTDGLDLIAIRVHEALPARGSIDLDSLCLGAGLGIADVLSALAILQMRGLAIRKDGRWRRVALDASPEPRARSKL